MKPPADAKRTARWPTRAVVLAWGMPLASLLLLVLWLVAPAPRREPDGPLREAPTAAGTPPAGQSLFDQIPPDGGLVATRWQSAHVLTGSVTLESEPSPGFLHIHVPEGGATFEAAFGINPQRWSGLASGPFRFRVAVLTTRGEQDRGERKLLLEEQIDPAREVGDRRWFPVRVDLDRYAGQELLLALSVSTRNLVDAPGDLAGWADPRLVSRTPGATTPAAS